METWRILVTWHIFVSPSLRTYPQFNMRDPSLLIRRCLLALLFAGPTFASAAPSQTRLTVWDLKLGAHVYQMPPIDEFKGYACGSNGGPPRQQLSGWSEYAKCRSEDDGLHEVYFEYDDELEYIARAKELPRELSRFAGTMERSFAIIVSALFDDAGVLRGLRLVSDARPDRRPDAFMVEMKSRAEAYELGGAMAARFGIESDRDCRQLPRAEGESSVGSTFIKRVCEKLDPGTGTQVSLRVNYYRKPGQSGRNPFLETQLTKGEFESSTWFEIRLAGGQQNR